VTGALPLATNALANAPDAVVTRFIGFVLLAVSSVSFGVLARRNRRLNRFESRTVFWRYLVLTGVAGAAYGGFGVVWTVTNARLSLAFMQASLLVLIVVLSFAMREVYFDRADAPTEDRFSLETLRRVEVGFVVVILLEWLRVLLLGRSAILRVVLGGGSLAFATYGVVFGESVQSRGTTQGTALDTLLRHLIPTLICVGLIGLGDLVGGLGVSPVIVGSVENVFVVMTATFLVTATIRLQQNVEGL